MRVLQRQPLLWPLLLRPLQLLQPAKVPAYLPTTVLSIV
jgi:hypothetical protein